MKAPEQLAEEYAEFETQGVPDSIRKQLLMTKDKMAFLAGYKAAKDQLADADKVMPQWISVKERLPEVGTWCLWMYPTGPEVNQYEGKLDDGTMLFHRSWYDSEDEVTYWMPLPEPPKKENK